MWNLHTKLGNGDIILKDTKSGTVEKYLKDEIGAQGGATALLIYTHKKHNTTPRNRVEKLMGIKVDLNKW